MSIQKDEEVDRIFCWSHIVVFFMVEIKMDPEYFTEPQP